MRETADKLDAADEEAKEAERELQIAIEETKNASDWLASQPLMGDDDLIKLFASEREINLSQAKNTLFTYPRRYLIKGKDVPSIVKEMRTYRRTLKGSQKVQFTKSIDNLIDAYTDHLGKCIDSIHWIKKYKVPLQSMVLNEEQLYKLYLVKEEEKRRKMVDSLCKYWEASLERKEIPFNKEYASLTKQMTNEKKAFKLLLKETPISTSPKDEIRKAILDSVCYNPGISARQIHDQLPKKLQNRSSSRIIAKLAKDENITSVDGAYYKINDEIKKNIWAYTAAFIDSDGYITMDKNHNPRVGLVATGNRGKAFMLEMHKSIGMGRLHLDQKSPQDTRLINRLNFYSGTEITDLLTKCLPHFKLKKNNAKVLLELIKIKKENKKEDWYKERKGELFKLMKYYNHSDNSKFDWKAWDIDIDNISKLEQNSKMEF
tara:strand:- start:5549 stop:6844 length:1296 start_codon:yes stop_codon:yes gene_type:complete